MDTMLAGLQDAVAYLDDVIVGKSQEERPTKPQRVLNRIDEFGFTSRPEKCCFDMDCIQYLGFVFDKLGHRSDPAKIEAIKRMPAPNDTASLRSFLGTLNYYGSFIKDARNPCTPGCASLKKPPLHLVAGLSGGVS
ncbi:hypothetical protein M514_11749 [Trichuris suis]|uniref:Reverse transcriptase domain-containing protein n=1 Tax=Trichuris suis TaxID=68888 RepID=A0A085LQZ0_9BILA|nr:hypothetical protein M513_11749 [Trichuris suis]KFD61373.1 hypothetical protein M514_11749 [Trichuris suis]